MQCELYFHLYSSDSGYSPSLDDDDDDNNDYDDDDYGICWFSDVEYRIYFLCSSLLEQVFTLSKYRVVSA